MLKFFRRIRRKLMEEGRLKGYLPYAVGEIVLVVIGILIALQINSWKESRNDRKLEIEILGEIRENLIQDRIDHDQNMSNFNIIVKSAEIILNHLNNDLSYHDSLAYYFSWVAVPGANFDAVTSGYQLLTSKGIHLIQNDSLRMEISSLYERDFGWLRGILKDHQYLYSNLLFKDMMQKFKTFDWINSAIPADYEELKYDDTFKILVLQQISIMQYTKLHYGRIYQQSEALISRIEEELK